MNFTDYFAQKVQVMSTKTHWLGRENEKMICKKINSTVNQFQISSDNQSFSLKEWIKVMLFMWLLSKKCHLKVFLESVWLKEVINVWQSTWYASFAKSSDALIILFNNLNNAFTYSHG